jgi:hypothetical protein
MVTEDKVEDVGVAVLGLVILAQCHQGRQGEDVGGTDGVESAFSGMEAELGDKVVDMAAVEGVPADAGSWDAEKDGAPEDGRSSASGVRDEEDPVDEGRCAGRKGRRRERIEGECKTRRAGRAGRCHLDEAQLHILDWR